jgi:hypothetical protein
MLAHRLGASTLVALIPAVYCLGDAAYSLGKRCSEGAQAERDEWGILRVAPIAGQIDRTP